VQERAAAAEWRAELAAAAEEEVFSIKALPSAFLSAVLLRGPQSDRPRQAAEKTAAAAAQRPLPPRVPGSPSLAERV
jgi:hypothetical protein